MTQFKDAFRKEVDDLKTLRDELKVKAHLAKADLRDEFDKIDTRWPEVERVAKNVEDGINDVGAQVEQAARQVFGELKKAYQDLAHKTKT